MQRRPRPPRRRSGPSFSQDPPRQVVPHRGRGTLATTSRPCQRAAVAAMAKRASPVSEPEPDDPASRYRRYSRASAWTVSGASSWSAMLRSRSSRSSEGSGTGSPVLWLCTYASSPRAVPTATPGAYQETRSGGRPAETSAATMRTPPAVTVGPSRSCRRRRTSAPGRIDSIRRG